MIIVTDAGGPFEKSGFREFCGTVRSATRISDEVCSGSTCELSLIIPVGPSILQERQSAPVQKVRAEVIDCRAVFDSMYENKASLGMKG